MSTASVLSAALAFKPFSPVSVAAALSPVSTASSAASAATVLLSAAFAGEDVSEACVLQAVVPARRAAIIIPVIKILYFFLSSFAFMMFFLSWFYDLEPAR